MINSLSPKKTSISYSLVPRLSPSLAGRAWEQGYISYLLAAISLIPRPSTIQFFFASSFIFAYWFAVKIRTVVKPGNKAKQLLHLLKKIAFKGFDLSYSKLTVCLSLFFCHLIPHQTSREDEVGG